SHVGGRRAAAAEARGDARIAGRIERPGGARGVEFFGNQVERLVPGDRNETRILAAALARVGALHRAQDAVRIVRLLDEAERLYAGLTAGRMDARRSEVGIDLGRDAVLDPHLEEIRPGHALVAVGRDGAVAAGSGSHDAPDVIRCARRRAWRP